MIILTCDGYEYDFPHHDIHYSYAQKFELLSNIATMDHLPNHHV